MTANAFRRVAPLDLTRKRRAMRAVNVAVKANTLIFFTKLVALR